MSKNETERPAEQGHRHGVVVVPPRGNQIVLWVIAVLLAVIATTLVTRLDSGGWALPALAQSPAVAGRTQAGAGGIYAFTGQLTHRSYGLFMLDVDTGTVWCYEMERGASGQMQMRLVAARSWIFDRYLEEFNCAEPIPGAVKTMVKQQAAFGGGEPVPPAAPGPDAGGEELPALPAPEPEPEPEAP